MTAMVASPTVLAARLRMLRLGAGLTQVELAGFLSTGCNRVSQWETGAVEPGLQVLRRYGSVFNRSLAQLLEDVQ